MEVLIAKFIVYCMGFAALFVMAYIPIKAIVDHARLVRVLRALQNPCPLGHIPGSDWDFNSPYECQRCGARIG
jgi:hypothetical protein